MHPAGVSSDNRTLATLRRIGLVAVVVAVTIRAWMGRLPGWNPDSLWFDDLVFAAIAQASDLTTALTLPTHAEPGFLAALWGLRRTFDDPEWSLQLLPFVCGLAAIPVMALAVRQLTRDDGLALLAAGLTALNPLLAHYSLFVKQYAPGFLVTALMLWGAAWLFDETPIQPRRLVVVALGGAAALFFSVTSAFVSAPTVALGVWQAVRSRTRPVGAILLSAAGFATAFGATYVLLRNRANPRLQNYHDRGFLELESFDTVWRFLTVQGRRLLETSLPTWTPTNNWDPQTVSWPLVFVGLGLAWLLARRATRPVGVMAAAFYGACLTASVLRFYPLGVDRTDIFAFPVGILLAAGGVHGLTALTPRAGLTRLAVGLTVAGFAIAQPVRASYWDVDDARLVRHLRGAVLPSDGVILSSAGTYLVSFYGDWPVHLSATARRANATQADVIRERTASLHPGIDRRDHIGRLIRDGRPPRLWYVAFRTRNEPEVLKILEDHDYVANEVMRTSRGRLYFLLDRRAPASTG